MKILEKTNWKAFELAIKKSPEELIHIIKEKKLTGRSGASFPTWMKFDLTSKQEEKEKYFLCNAHEGEPGTFKDLFIIENNPDTLIEGIAIGSYIIGAKKAYIYFKHGYPDLLKKLKATIKKSKPYLEIIGLDITVLTGAGAYICGEETAIIDSIEGLRGEPRKKPPFTAEIGLFGKPTMVDNVETITNIPLLLTKDDWNDDLRLFSISGNVNNPGVYEYSLGVSLKELLDKADAGSPKAVYLGASGGCIPATEDINLCQEDICCKGAGLGCRTMIVIDKNQSIVDMAKNLAEFFVHESCGKCTPCREGNFRVLELIDKISDGRADKGDLETLEELIDFIPSTSFCGLGQTSTIHIKTALNFFRKEFEEKCK